MKEAKWSKTNTREGSAMTENGVETEEKANEGRRRGMSKDVVGKKKFLVKL